MKRLRTSPPRRALGLRALLLSLALCSSLRSGAAAAEPELLLWGAPPPAAAFCADGKTLPAPPLAFALPALAAAPGGGGDCDEALPRALPEDALAAALGRPLKERSRYLALYPDGHTAPVEIVGAVRRPGAGGEAFVLGAPACAAAGDGQAPAAGGAGAGGRPDGDVPDAGPEPDAARPDGGAPVAPGGAAAPGAAGGVPACPPEPKPPLALLLRPTTPGPPRPTDAAALSGVVRRRIGRQSLPARGHLVGSGHSVAAIFKRRADAVQLAIFGEDGNLRLYQPVPWRRGKRVQAKPASLLVVPDLGGPGQDGLLVIGASDGGPLPLLLGFSGKAVRAYP